MSGACFPRSRCVAIQVEWPRPPPPPRRRRGRKLRRSPHGQRHRTPAARRRSEGPRHTCARDSGVRRRTAGSEKMDQRVCVCLNRTINCWDEAKGLRLQCEAWAQSLTMRTRPCRLALPTEAGCAWTQKQRNTTHLKTSGVTNLATAVWLGTLPFQLSRFDTRRYFPAPFARRTPGGGAGRWRSSLGCHRPPPTAAPALRPWPVHNSTPLQTKMRRGGGRRR